MLDIKFLRENPEVVKQNIRNKFQDQKLELVDKVIELDKENRDIKQEVEALRAKRNKIAKQILIPLDSFFCLCKLTCRNAAWNLSTDRKSTRLNSSHT